MSNGITNEVLEQLRTNFPDFEIYASDTSDSVLLHSIPLFKRGGIRLVGGEWAAQSATLPCRYFSDPVTAAEYATSTTRVNAGKP